MLSRPFGTASGYFATPATARITEVVTVFLGRLANGLLSL